ncbi:MmcQ/YjbR family DNA-binding protein [Vitiosangium sp. GDMCC 1.1324]|uniref:MmcQ/YjbR family DNA-binding protein n=1 Tax=Vitiosangium sp. (strain GDMCC 1.1324) TaxID=2138576 RepID=UPI000D3D1B23|nr:MmcQ/YjbR family DNA-binding protein [Vitiosangium sp. GDMCC 1.1324]PTL82877.1 DifB protein [Vitiosangium sp. GDMCC 1.1324]
MSMTPVPPEMKRLVPFEMALREAGMSYPEVTEDFPWGHRTLKVKGKAFIFMGLSTEGFSLSVKLPESNGAALMLPFVQPTGYGLGKSGWVSANFGARDTPPLDMLRKWLDESYRAVAPKKLVAQLGGTTAPKTDKPEAAPARTRSAPARKSAPAAAKKPAAKKATPKKTVAKKTAGARARRA